MATVMYCENGHYVGTYNQLQRVPWHVLRNRLENPQPPEARPRFCAKCGAPNLSECPDCQALIPEQYPGQTPNYCVQCGKPFPWTATALAAAREYADELEQLTNEEKTTLKDAVVDLTTDTPRTPLAATRYKKLLAKLGPMAAATMQKIVEVTLTEAAKKMING